MTWPRSWPKDRVILTLTEGVGWAGLTFDGRSAVKGIIVKGGAHAGLTLLRAAKHRL